MERKTVSGVMLSLLLMSISTLVFNLQPVEAEPTTWTVDDDGPADFSSIQQAINSPLVASGDTIFVYSGTYYENVIIDKTVSLVGENPINTIVDGCGSGDVISVKASNTVIENLTVRNSGSSANYGIRLAGVTNCNIKNNRITSNSRGLYFDFYAPASNNSISENNITDNRRGIAMGEGPNGYRCSFNSIYRNNIKSNGECGMFLAGAYSNSIYENNITNNGGWGGILIVTSADNNISRNNITANHGAGIFNAGEYYAFRNLISGNIIANNLAGIYLCHASRNVISANQIVNNRDFGVSLVSSTWGGFGNSGNKIFENNITANGCGISLFSDSPIGSGLRTTSNIAHANIIANNDCGVYLEGVLAKDNNIIYHNNFVDNTHQVYIGRLGDGSIWNEDYPSGGNFWSDYADVDLYSGSNQDLPGMDGIWDHPYTIDVNNRDQYPLVKHWPTIPVTADVDPDTMNLRSRSKWITAYIELPTRYDINNIDVSTIMLNDTFSADFTAPTQIGDHDMDGIPDLMVKFNRTQLKSYIYRVLGIKYGSLTLKITGKLLDGTPFEGTAVIFVNYAGDVNNDGEIDILDAAAVSAHLYLDHQQDL